MFKLTYTLRDHGWAVAEISNGEAAFSISASYMGDPLGDLARATRGLICGLPQVTFDFIQEPGFHCFEVTRQGDDVFVEAFRLTGLFPSGAEAGESVFLATCSLISFVDAVITCLSSVLEEVGEEEYLRRWKRQPFPSLELEELVTLRRQHLTGAG